MCARQTLYHRTTPQALNFVSKSSISNLRKNPKENCLNVSCTGDIYPSTHKDSWNFILSSFHVQKSGPLEFCWVRAFLYTFSSQDNQFTYTALSVFHCGCLSSYTFGFLLLPEFQQSPGQFQQNIVSFPWNRDWGSSSVAECLPGIVEALGLILSTRGGEKGPNSGSSWKLTIPLNLP